MFNHRLMSLDPKLFKLLHQNGAKNDFIHFAEHCMHIMRKIFTLCMRPIVFFVDYQSNSELPKEFYAMKTIMAMNNYAIAVMKEHQFPFNQKIMLDYLRESYMSQADIKKMDQYISTGISFEQAQSYAQNSQRNLAPNMQMY